MSEGVGRLDVELGLNSAQFTDGLTRAERQAQQFGANMRGYASTAAAGLAVAGTAAIAAAAALKQMVDVQSSAIAKMADLAASTGVSVEKISALDSIARRTGSSFADVGAALAKINTALNSAKANSPASLALDAIGLSAAKLKQLSPDEALLSIGRALDKFADTGSKARAGTMLLGDSYARLAPLMKDIVAQGDLVAKVTSDQAAMAKKYQDQLRELDASITDVARSLTLRLLPALLSVSAEFKALVSGTKTSDTLQTEVRNIESEIAKLEALKGKGFTIAGFFGSEAARDAEIAKLQAQALKVKSALALMTPFEGDFKGSDAIKPVVKTIGDPAEFEALLKKRLDAQLKVIQQFAKDQAAGFRFAEQYTQQVRAAGLMSLQQSFDVETRVRHAASDAAISEQLKIASAQEAFAAAANSAADRAGGLTAAQVARRAATELGVQATRDDALATGALADALARVRQASRDAAAASGDYLANLERDQARGLAALPRGDAENARIAGRNQILDKYAADTRLNEKLKRDAEAEGAYNSDRQRLYEETAARIADAQDKALQGYDANVQARIALEGDWVTGAKKAIADYNESVRDSAAQTRELFRKSFQGAEDALVKFVKTGKLDFKALAESIIEDLIRIEIRAVITAAIQAAVGQGGGKSSGGGSLLSTLFGGGASAGGAAAAGTEADVLAMFVPLATGMDRVPHDGFRASLHAGERVLSAQQARAADKGLTVNIHNSAGAEVSTQRGDDGNLEVFVRAAVAAVDWNISSGTGSTASALKSRGVGLDGRLPRRA